jgi:hypothetical protein
MEKLNSAAREYKQQVTREMARTEDPGSSFEFDAAIFDGSDEG